MVHHRTHGSINNVLFFCCIYHLGKIALIKVIDDKLFSSELLSYVEFYEHLLSFNFVAELVVSSVRKNAY